MAYFPNQSRENNIELSDIEEKKLESLTKKYKDKLVALQALVL